MVERRVVEVSVTFAVELGRVRVPFAVEMIERKVVGVLVISPVELGLVAKTWALDVEANVDESVQFAFFGQQQPNGFKPRDQLSAKRFSFAVLP